MKTKKGRLKRLISGGVMYSALSDRGKKVAEDKRRGKRTLISAMMAVGIVYPVVTFV